MNIKNRGNHGQPDASQQSNPYVLAVLWPSKSSSETSRSPHLRADDGERCLGFSGDTGVLGYSGCESSDALNPVQTVLPDGYRALGPDHPGTLTPRTTWPPWSTV